MRSNTDSSTEIAPPENSGGDLYSSPSLQTNGVFPTVTNIAAGIPFLP